MARFLVKASEFKNVCKAVNDRKLAELKKEIIEILKKQDEKEVKKAIDYFESQELHYTHLEKSFNGKWVEKAGYGVGTVRIWKGKKYKKIAPGKWARVFEKEGRGTNIAIGKLIAKVQKIDNVEDLMAFVMANKQRFVDENGVDLPVLDKLRAAVDAKNNGGMRSKLPDPKDDNSVAEYKKQIKDKVKEYNMNYEKYLENQIAGAERHNVTENELKALKELQVELKETSKPAEKKEELSWKDKVLMATDEGAKKELGRGKMYKKHITDIQRIANSNINDIPEKLKTLNDFIEYQDSLSNPDYKQAGKDYARLKNHELAREIWKKVEDGEAEWDDNGYLKLNEHGLLAKPEKKEEFPGKDLEQKKKQLEKLELRLSDLKSKDVELTTRSQGNWGDGMRLSKLPSNKAWENNREKIEGVKAKIEILKKEISEEEEKPYWIQDSKGNRLTNEDAKEKIKVNLKKIDELSKGDEARKDIKIRDMKNENDYLMERLNQNDKRDMEIAAKFYESEESETDKGLSKEDRKKMANEVGDINHQELFKEITESEKNKKYDELYKKYFPVEPKIITDAREEWLSRTTDDEITDEVVKSGEEQAKKMNDDFLMQKLEQFRNIKPKDIDAENEQHFKFWVLNHIAKRASRETFEDAMDMFNIPFKPYTENYNKRNELALSILEKEAKRRGLDKNESEKGGTKKVKKSIFDDLFEIGIIADNEIDYEKELEEGETEYNDYSAEQPELFNSTELMVREAFNRCRVL